MIENGAETPRRRLSFSSVHRKALINTLFQQTLEKDRFKIKPLQIGEIHERDDYMQQHLEAPERGASIWWPRQRQSSIWKNPILV